MRVGNDLAFEVAEDGSVLASVSFVPVSVGWVNGGTGLSRAQTPVSVGGDRLRSEIGNGLLEHGRSWADQLLLYLIGRCLRAHALVQYRNNYMISLS